MDNDHGIAGELRRFITDPLLGYASQSQHIERLTAIADRIDAAMAERYMELPVDADGEVIHIGDEMDTEHFGMVEVEGFVHRAVAFYNYGGQPAYLCTTPANLCRHHHEPTVEDVLRDFGVDIAHALDADPDATVPEATIAKYAAKLRLAGDEQ